VAENEYDDSLLQTSEAMGDVDWDNIETGGLAAEGKHLATIKKIGGYLHNFKDYTGPRAKVQFQIKEGKDKGKTVYDDITLPHPQESDGSRNRRILIASRLGLIPRGSKETHQVNWKVLENRDVLITVEHNRSQKNNKMYANVAFDGWEDPATGAAAPLAAAGAAAPAQDRYADI